MATFFASIQSGILIEEHLVIAFLILTTLSVFLRGYVRLCIKKDFGIDDWSMMFCWLFFVVFGALAFVATMNIGEILRTGIITAEIQNIIRATAGLYVLTMIALKISLGAFFLKIFVIPRQWQRPCIYAMVAVQCSYGVVYFVFNVATCATTFSSAGYGFDATECAVQDAFLRISRSWSVINAATDLAFSALAIQALWTIKVPLPAKISASGLLLLGTIGGIASVIRTVYLWSIETNFLASAYWTVVEPGLGIVAASLITLRPLFQCLRERAGSRSRSRRDNTRDAISIPSALTSNRTRAALHDWTEDSILEGSEKDRDVGADVVNPSVTDMKGISAISLQTHNLV